MLLLGILGNIGVYTGAVEMMQQWHVFFSLSIGGIIAGMVEAAEEVHEGLGYAPCHGYDYPTSKDGSPNSWGGTMGDHMGGWGSMMGW